MYMNLCYGPHCVLKVNLLFLYNSHNLTLEFIAYIDHAGTTQLLPYLCLYF